MLKNALQFSHQLLAEVIQPGDHVIDATMGNGYDTCFLAQKVGEKGRVYAFDIQQQALANTRERLTKDELTNQVQLIHDGHENIADYVAETQSIQAAIFNLGYLPQADKTLITQPQTTIQALHTLRTRLAVKGRIVIVAYWGHEGGAQELQNVETFCQNLPQEQYNVLTYQFINQQNQPPILFCIERKR